MKPRAASLLLAASLLVAVTSAQGRRLNGPLATAVNGDVSTAIASPDGSRAVFIAEGELNGQFDLYSAPLGGGAPVHLTPTLALGGDVTSFLVTPDSARVVYIADQDVDERFELYSVPIAGGPATRISGALAPNLDVTGFALSASTGRVVYRVIGGADLFSVPSDGSAAPVQLNAGPSFERVETDFAISHDGLGVAYRSDALVDGRLDLWVVTIDGSIAPQLRAAGPGTSDVIEFAFAPGDQRLVYRADHENAALPELYSVPVVGGAPTKLNPALASGGSVIAYALSPDGAHVAYIALQEEGQPRGLYSVPIGGGAATELESSGVRSLVVGGAGPYRVVYLDDEDVNGVDELHTVPLGGGASTQFALPDADVQSGFELSPDGARVVFTAVGTLTPGRWLYSAPIGGGGVVQLNFVSPTANQTNVTSFEIAPDSASVLHLASQLQVNWNQSEVWSTPIEGGAATRLSADMVANGDATFAQLDPTGARVLYHADQDTNGVVELYSVASSGGAATKLSPPLTSGGTTGDVLDFRLHPAGVRAVYLADQEVDDVQELFGVRTSGGAPVRLNAAFASDRDVTAFEVSPDWSRVVYRADQDANEAYRLHAAPIDGGPAVALDAGSVAGGDVEGFVVSPDSARVVYRADQDADEVFELYSAPIAGGAVVQLNPALVAGGDVVAGLFRVSADSSRVVYVADQDANDVLELWSVPIAGGAAVRLNHALAGGGDVANFEIAADSSRVVYRADEGGRAQVWSVPLAGGSAARLNATLAFGGNVASYRLAADSSRIVYLADQDQDEVWELFSVPLSGGSAVQLNAALASGGDVQTADGDYAISADSTLVLYRADQDTDGVVELYRVELDGGAPVRLNEPLPAGRAVASFALAPDSTRAVYCADQDADDVFELYGVALGSGAITRLHAPRDPEGSTPSGYLVTPDSTSVVLACDLVVPDSLQLYALPLTGAGPRSLSGEISGGDVEAFDVRGGRALYIASPTEFLVNELFVATLPRPLRDGSVAEN